MTRSPKTKRAGRRRTSLLSKVSAHSSKEVAVTSNDFTRASKTARSMTSAEVLSFVKRSRTAASVSPSFVKRITARTATGALFSAARSSASRLASFQTTSEKSRSQRPQATSTSVILSGRRSLRPFLNSAHTRSATRASASPFSTICRISCSVSGATVKSGNLAAKRAVRRMRTGSSEKALLTCRRVRCLRSCCPPYGSMTVPSSVSAMALTVRSRRLRSSSSVTSGAA